MALLICATQSWLHWSLGLEMLVIQFPHAPPHSQPLLLRCPQPSNSHTSGAVELLGHIKSPNGLLQLESYPQQIYKLKLPLLFLVDIHLFSYKTFPKIPESERSIFFHRVQKMLDLMSSNIASILFSLLSLGYWNCICFTSFSYAELASALQLRWSYNSDH